MQKKLPVTADGKHVIMNGALFKRTVLPSAAKPHDSALEIAEQLDDLDKAPKEI
jgi:hypothetical protein